MTDSLGRISGIVTKFKGLTTIGFTNIVATAISGLFWLYIARLLGTTHYGEISYLIAVSGIATVISFLGSGNILLVYTAKGIRIQPAVYTIALAASSIAAVILFFIFQDIGVSLFVIGNVIFGLVTNELIGQKSYKQYSVYMISQKILGTVLAIALYYSIGTSGVILGLSISFFLPIHRIYEVFKDNKIDFSLLKARSGFIINSYIMDISRAFSTTLDKLIVAPLLGFALLGNYQLGVQFLSLLGILPGIIYQYILPHDASGNANIKLKKAAILFSVLLAILGIVLAPIFLPLLFPKFTEATQVIQILSISIIAATINLTYISKFLGGEKSRIVLIGSAIYLSIQISSIIILGKIMGVNGAAIAVVIATFSETAYLVSVDRFIRKKVEIPIREPSENPVILLEEKKVDNTDGFHFKYSIPLLISIGIISLLLRLYYFPYNVPLTLDALNGYFFSATDVSILGRLTASTIGAHDGWTIFLSLFFTIFRFDNFLDYMTLQRCITVGLSLLTIIPVYFLCKRFTSKPYAIAGASIFAFDPRLIQNSLLGISEPLYILLLSSSFALYFSSNRKLMYVSFVLVGLSTTIRAEGFFVFLPMITMFYIRNRKENKVVLKVILAVAIFILLLLPIALFRISISGNDALTGRILQGTNQVLTTSHNTGTLEFLKIATENAIKLGGWSLVPIFMILLPIGIYFFIKERDIEKSTILVIIILMLLPVFYAFSLSNQDTRYMYPLFPLFSIVSALTIKKALGKTTHQNLVLLIIVAILLASTAFLEFKKFDYEHQMEAFGIAHKVIAVAGGVNAYYPEDSYIIPAELPEKWPTLKSSIEFKTNLIPIFGFDSLIEYIKSSEEKGLTHLVLDGQKTRPSFLNDVYYHQEKYPYLVEVYDSSKDGFKYHVKIFKIDYDIFNSFIH
jgi:O-antigen/teichoic acid export membrane protein